jgi:integrase/recombinase XerD
MNDNTFLSSWIKRFLLEYLMSVRNLARNTQRSYRDTIRLLLPFVAKIVKKSIDKLAVPDVSAEIIKKFLSNLENTRNCSVRTRNQRLAAIHAFARFVGLNCPEYVDWCRTIQQIPLKKAAQSTITYLEKNEMDALLDTPNKATAQGKRDYAMLLFLYNTGARADEAAQLTIADLELANANKGDFSYVTIKGKGNKLRRCPLWATTVNVLVSLISGRDQTESVFLNRCNQPITRFGIHNLVKRYYHKILPQLPSLKHKIVSPHTIRHTTATHLLRAGVDINTIRAWLGHVSINTTNIYAEVDLEMKAKALALCEITENSHGKAWRKDQELMEFLDAL